MLLLKISNIYYIINKILFIFQLEIFFKFLFPRNKSDKNLFFFDLICFYFTFNKLSLFLIEPSKKCDNFILSFIIITTISINENIMATIVFFIVIKN